MNVTRSIRPAPQNPTALPALLFVIALAYKLVLEYAYWNITSLDTVVYSADFSLLKYLNGLVWFVVLFCGIRHHNRKASSFLLYLLFFMQVVPITVIYGLGNWQAGYYNLLCASIWLCELLVRQETSYLELSFRRLKTLSNLMLLFFFAVLAVLLLSVVLENGLPGAAALNLGKVYSVRAEFRTGKYVTYLLQWFVHAISPFLVAKAILDRQYPLALAACFSVFLLFLYSGNKIYLFSIPVCIACCLMAKLKHANFWVFALLCAGFILLIGLYLFFNRYGIHAGVQRMINWAYSLLARRTMFDSANNKFLYYDFFSENPQLGFSGIFPTWFIRIEDPYHGENYQVMIAQTYWGSDANNNTGFLAEGFMRFGHIGIPLLMLLFTVFLRLADQFQLRTSYELAVGALAYPVYALSEGHFFDSSISGPWFFIWIILLFYCANTAKTPVLRPAPLSGYLKNRRR